MDNIKLYELSDAIRNVLDGMAVVNEETGELYDISNVDDLSIAFDEKLDSCGCYLRELVATYEAITNEAARLDRKAKLVRKRIERMQDYMSKCMDDAGKDRVNGKHVTVKFRHSSAVNVYDVDKLPDAYTRVTHKIEPDKPRIKAAINAGHDVPGAEIEQRKFLVVD